MKKNANNKNKTKYVVSIILIVIVTIILITVLIKNISKKSQGLSYEITYNGIDCPTPYVVFTESGTYEYYEHYGIGDSDPKPSTGKYEYDMDKLIKNVNNYEEDRRGPYTIKVSNGDEYTTYSSNKELRELLDTNNIVLEKCMTTEDE